MNPPEVISLGETYGRLTVVAKLPASDRQRYYLCRCECGTEVPVRGRHLRSGNTKSCGCLKRQTAAENAKAHASRGGASTHPLYYAWRAMIARCDVPHHPSYHRYGGRGITVCAGWRADPRSFYADMGKRPHDLSIDRIDNDGNYSCGHCEDCQSKHWPANCKWSTRKQQQANRAKQSSRFDIEAIRALAATGVPQHEIARRHAISPSHVSKIIAGERC